MNFYNLRTSTLLHIKKFASNKIKWTKKEKGTIIIMPASSLCEQKRSQACPFAVADSYRHVSVDHAIQFHPVEQIATRTVLYLLGVRGGAIIEQEKDYTQGILLTDTGLFFNGRARFFGRGGSIPEIGPIAQGLKKTEMTWRLEIGRRWRGSVDL